MSQSTRGTSDGPGSGGWGWNRSITAIARSNTPNTDGTALSAAVTRAV